MKMTFKILLTSIIAILIFFTSLQIQKPLQKDQIAPLKIALNDSNVQARGISLPKPKSKPKPIFDKYHFKMPPKYAKTRTYKGKRQVQYTFADGSTKWKTIYNGKYANKTYLGVKFDKTGFPNFKSKFQMTLKNSSLKMGRDPHFTEANKALKKAYEKNPKDFAKKFSKEEIRDIKNGATPRYCTWHHHQTRGLMKLVDREAHSNITHTGGMAIWGSV